MDASVSVLSEKYSDERVNLIFEINEGNQSNINKKGLYFDSYVVTFDL